MDTDLQNWSLNVCSCYPTASMFFKNSEVKGTAGEDDEEDDDFKTDEDEEMEVDTQVVQKRKKVCNIYLVLL